jgi:hypothetical protein
MSFTCVTRGLPFKPGQTLTVAAKHQHALILFEDRPTIHRGQSIYREPQIMRKLGMVLILLGGMAALGVTPAAGQRVTTMQKNYKIVVHEDLVVRRLRPPAVYDEKGKPRKPTEQELKEMKGDPKQKGYAADAKDLKAGQIVVVTLARGKEEGETKSGKESSKKPPYKILGEYTGKIVRPPAAPNAKAKQDDAGAKPTVVIGFEALRLPGQPTPPRLEKTPLPANTFAVRIMIIGEPPSE